MTPYTLTELSKRLPEGASIHLKLVYEQGAETPGHPTILFRGHRVGRLLDDISISPFTDVTVGMLRIFEDAGWEVSDSLVDRAERT